MDDKKASRLQHWERHWRKWYLLYFYLGVGINFLLYFTKPYGFDPSGSILWGSFYGIGIPLSTMFIGAHIHRKIWGI
ncbi:MAG: hypothetical protein H5U10_13830 [Desulfacinum sp.]|jgi:hypothetical protein|nr:hypothetical protein [Desulfacinum sp.]